MAEQKTSYTPINCSYYDVLLDLATRKLLVEIRYADEGGNEISTQDKIVDVYTRKGEEFMVLASDTTIRLDRIISVNGEVMADWDSCGI